MREFDLRNSVKRTPMDLPARGLELERRASSLSADLPDARIRVSKIDTSTGNAAEIEVSGFDSGSGPVVDRALNYLSTISGVLGFEPGQAPEFVANPQSITTNSGAQSVYAQQHFRAIPIFQATQTVIFSPSGSLHKSTGVSVGIPVNASFQVPTVRVEDAVRTAAVYLSTHPEDSDTDIFGNVRKTTLPSMDTVSFTVVAQFADRADIPTVLLPGPFANYIMASLTWFAVGDVLRPSWQIILVMPAAAGQYRILVDAASGDVLYCTEISRSILAKGQVYRVDGGHEREQISWPLALSTYGLTVPSVVNSNFPYSWVADKATNGISVTAHSGDADPPVAGTSDGQMMSFVATDPQGIAQAVINAFYFNCYMHDFLYLLGFRETDGNFQTDNFGFGGVATDQVEVSVYPGAVWATANMMTPADGASPTMKLGLVTSTGRHTAFDASVVFHEATHGLTSRLVGGALDSRSLEAPQSAGMSEGWSDFVACQILGNNVVGSWVTGQPNGVRAFPYDENYPANFGNLGKDRYTEMHAIGEIWCATLMDLARKIGREDALRLLVDSLKLLPSNPSFLDARDAMILALTHWHMANTINNDRFTLQQNALWSSFSRAGMGPAAKSDGATLTGIVPDFSAPAGTGSSATWSNWQRTGPAGTVPATASIAATAAAGSTTELYVVGGDGFLYMASRQGSSATWSNWQRTGPVGTVPATASIAATAAAGSTTELYVVGGDGFLYASGHS